MKKRFLIITNYNKKFFKKIFKKFRKQCKYEIYDLRDKNEKKLFLNSSKKFDYLISFANSYIFNKRFLSKFNFYRRINFHPATPNYPGRDSHHFACFNKEKIFGGTMHIMNNKIDSGPILDIKKIKMKSKKKHHEHFQKIGYLAIENLLKKNLKNIIDDKLQIRNNIKWGGKIYTRNKFLSRLKVNKNTSKTKLCNLINSFYTKDRDSLYIELHKKFFFLKMYD
jgi:methionyl-tRNA formyltransferase